MNFIVIEPDPLVQMDVKGILSDAFPGARIIAGATLSDVGTSIEEWEAGSRLLLRSTMVADDLDLQSSLQAAISRDIRIVLVGESLDVDFAIKHVELPFTADLLVEAVR